MFVGQFYRKLGTYYITIFFQKIKNENCLLLYKGDGFVVCRQYFDIDAESLGITIPQIRQWGGPLAGFTFHCWLRLDKLGPVFVF